MTGPGELTKDAAPAPGAAEADPGNTRGLTTRAGVSLQIRPAEPADLPRLEEFFGKVTAEDLRYRFLSALRQVDGDRLQAMVRTDDDPRVVDFLAIEPGSGEVIATATIAADEALETAEFAICTRADRKQLGVSWTVLERLVAFASQSGIKRLRSIQAADDQVAMQLEREMGFTVALCPDDATLMIAEKQLGNAG